MTVRWFAAAVVALAPTLARGGDDVARGAVVKIEDREIYVSLGDAQGVTAGDALRIKRTIQLRHPVTRAAIEDWIPIGAAQVTEAGRGLSRAVVGELVAAIRVGDTVEVLVDRPAPVPVAPATPAAPPIDLATAEVLAAFSAQASASLDARIAAWERYLSSRPGSPFAAAIRRDLDALEELRDQLRPAHRSIATTEPVDRVEHARPRSATPGEAVPLVFVLRAPERIASAYLHYRRVAQRTYQRVLLAREHDVYLRGAIPAAAVAAPGVEYYVEASTPAGRSGLALASPAEPLRVEVRPPPLAERFGSAPGRTSLRLGGEYLDFATFDTRAGDRRDRLIAGTLDVAYRLDGLVQRVGVGYGVIAGLGASTIEENPAPLPSGGFHYGHAAVELGRAEAAIATKLIAGVGRDGVGLGVEGAGRLGARDGTSVTVTARRLPELGWSTDVRLGARPGRPLLVGIGVGATNQPARGDVAAKLSTELEWLAHARVALLLRASWQGRAIQHGGVGGGAAVGVSW